MFGKINHFICLLFYLFIYFYSLAYTDVCSRVSLYIYREMIISFYYYFYFFVTELLYFYYTNTNTYSYMQHRCNNLNFSYGLHLFYLFLHFNYGKLRFVFFLSFSSYFILFYVDDTHKYLILARGMNK